ncbi:hypothetical protein HYFRA_00007080 [Hymenoscyphus fraxineus]|uniref:Uncharacterized protein n=1 Tax=Hymenoscyphus fraxineus TaxID=746836 RepID=A0A9N9KXW0_9HELO|nr:hypothetical protein HYFRA_00007080 [Hymenoscyphus fraxineus]
MSQFIVGTVDAPEDIEDDEEEEDAFAARRRRFRHPMRADEYIERVVGPRDDEITDSDVEITDVKQKIRKDGAVKAGEKVKWSDEDSDDAYKKFMERKSIKRKKTAATKKKLAEKTKKATAERKKQKKNGSAEPAKKKQRVWGDASDDDLVDMDMPEYFLDRRREFDQEYQKFQDSALQIPPSYDDIYFSDDERIAELQERPDFPASVERSRPYKDIELPNSLGIIPASIAQYLRDYQVKGVEFLHELFVYQKGGILGDDMGLGKTVQVAAFLTAAFGKTGDERDDKRMRKMRRAGRRWYPRVLIVCPGSLIQNWENELKRWGWWHIDKFHQKDRDAVLETAKAGRSEVVITTYQTYRNHKDHLNLVPWDCVVADECHTLKEIKSATTEAMNEINALCRIGLTGTAIQNKYEELWTLLNWCSPGRFGPLSTWKTSISGPLRQGQSHDATFHQLKQARETANKLVNNLLPEFFLRRMKSLIAHQLPKKTDKVIFCPLTDIQKEAYELFLESDIVEIVKYSTVDCECGSGKKRGWCCHVMLDGTSWKALVFPVIITLQKLSNHLALLIPNSNDSPEKQERDLEFLKTMVPDRWKELWANKESLFNLSNPEFCGKWKLLKRLLKQFHDDGDKVLIFSHSVRLLKMLHHLFNNTSYNVSFLSGEMPVDERQKTVDDFNSDPRQFVFLISTKAGGVGLNITSANKVIIFDPNWNPSYDLQAQDRAYRIGQTRDVEVFRLVSAGTVEEIVYARQIYKQQQANIGYSASVERRYFKGVQQSSGQKGEIFGLHNLLTYHGDNIVLRDIVNKTNVAEAKRGIDMIEINLEELDDDDNPLKVDNDDEDGAMSQLVALIEKGEDLKTTKTKPKPKMDPIQAILTSAGVQYTHENSEVVGSSKIEAELSRRAQETGNDVDYGQQKLFAESQNAEDQYVFHPPRDVMHRQFCTMAKTFGFENATEFALVVESWTQKQRTDCLERFYLKRKEGNAGDSFRSEPVSEKTTKEVLDVPTETEDENIGETVGARNADMTTIMDVPSPGVMTVIGTGKVDVDGFGTDTEDEDDEL